MGWSMKDMERGSKIALDAMEKRKQENAENIAQDLANRVTVDGRGMWLIVHFFFSSALFILVVAMVGYLFMIILSVLNVSETTSYFLGLIPSVYIGYKQAKNWYNSDLAKRQPFLILIYTLVVINIAVFILIGLDKMFL